MKEILKFQSVNIPAELKALDQWVCFRIEKRDGKPTKVPYNPKGYKASTTKPKTWAPFEDVVRSSTEFNGIGFVFSKDDPYTGIDLDNICQKGEPTPWFDFLVHMFGSYSKISISGRGLHIICKGSMPGTTGKKKAPYEMYSWGRFFTFTGCIYKDFTAITEAQRQINALYGYLIGK